MESVSTSIETRVCSHCKRELPITQYYKSSKKGDSGYQLICKDCMRESSREYKKRKRAQVLESTETANSQNTTVLPSISLKDFSTEKLMLEAKKRKDFDLAQLFTPRELMSALYKIGYRGELKIMIEQKVKLANSAF